jgi:coatomer protein complex subunit alpha (xenin)
VSPPGEIEIELDTDVLLSSDALAYHTAKSNGLTELAEEILEETGLTEDDIPQAGPSSASGSSLAPPPVVTSQAESNWPTKSMGESYFDKALAAAAADPSAEVAYTNGHSASAEKEDAWADEADEELIGGDEEAEEDDGWGLDAEDIVVEEDATEDQVPEDTGASLADGVSAGVPEDEQWTRNSPLAVDHAAAGSFESAMQVSCT